MEKSCVFCKIANGEVPTKFLFQDEGVLAFADINPKAKTHILVVPTTHVETFLDLQVNHIYLLTKMVKVVQQLVRDNNLQGGYRIQINGGRHQEVPHLHVHLLSD